MSSASCRAEGSPEDTRRCRFWVKWIVPLSARGFGCFLCLPLRRLFLLLSWECHLVALPSDAGGRLLAMGVEAVCSSLLEGELLADESSRRRAVELVLQAHDASFVAAVAEDNPLLTHGGDRRPLPPPEERSHRLASILVCLIIGISKPAKKCKFVGRLASFSK